MITENFKIKTYNSMTLDEKKLFLDFCKSTQEEKNKPAAANMWAENWKDGDPITLPYLLEYRDIFKDPKGNFFILYDDNAIIGCSGIYLSDFSDNIAVAGVRTWIDKKYRNQSLNKDYLLPIQKSWAIDRNIKIIALTFNRYNKSIIEIFKRTRLGEDAGRVNSRKAHHLFFNGVNEVPFSINVKHTEQWAIYEKLDRNFEFDWGSIKFKK